MTEIKKPHASPKDFFMHLLAIVALYTFAVNLGVLIFQIINFNFPDLLYYSDFGYGGAIRWSISAMIVALPTFIIAQKLITKDYLKDPEKKNLRIRNWLIYLTIFGTAVIVLIDLMSLIYQFLGGELTTRFLLKALTILFIAGTIFAYYVYKIKVVKENKMILNGFAVLAIATFFISVITGFVYIGSPAEQRLRSFDLSKISDLGSLSSSVQSYYYQYDELPRNQDELVSAGLYVPVDPQTSMRYEYLYTDALHFKVCAEFNLDKVQVKPGNRPLGESGYIFDMDYMAGKNCFDQSVIPSDKPIIR